VVDTISKDDPNHTCSFRSAHHESSFATIRAIEYRVPSV
jgi:hypothetical protein